MAARGFRTIKCAPFDEVDASKTGPDAVRAARIGIERVAAVRSAIGPDVRLLVDCHRRFDLESALVVADELSRLEIGWFEEPVDTETEQDDMAEIARRVSMPVAGGESLYGVAAFEGLMQKRAAHVIMPDVMFCGGARRGPQGRPAGRPHGRRLLAAQPVRDGVVADQRPRLRGRAESDAPRARGRRGPVASRAAEPA